MQCLNRFLNWISKVRAEIKSLLKEEMRYTIRWRCPACLGLSETKVGQVDIHPKMKVGRCPSCAHKLHVKNVESWVEPDWVKRENEKR